MGLKAWLWVMEGAMVANALAGEPGVDPAREDSGPGNTEDIPLVTAGRPPGPVKPKPLPMALLNGPPTPPMDEPMAELMDDPMVDIEVPILDPRELPMGFPIDDAIDVPRPPMGPMGPRGSICKSYIHL